MKLVFLHSSDTHGFLMPTDYQVSGDYTAPIGLSRVSSVVKSERKKYGADKVVVTDAGDCLQGSPLASYAHSTGDMADLDTFTQAYNKINYDASCLGLRIQLGDHLINIRIFI